MNNNNDDKLDVLIIHAVRTNDRLDSIDENLEQHMARSYYNEEQTRLLSEEIKPLVEHYKGFKWMLGALTAFTVVIKIIEFFKH